MMVTVITPALNCDHAEVATASGGYFESLEHIHVVPTLVSGSLAMGAMTAYGSSADSEGFLPGESQWDLRRGHLLLVLIIIQP